MIQNSEGIQGKTPVQHEIEFLFWVTGVTGFVLIASQQFKRAEFINESLHSSSYSQNKKGSP